MSKSFLTEPQISIITVVYNAETLLEGTLLSVLNQSYPHIEYIIVDGASKDGTMGIIRKYESKISQWISEKDHGIYDAMNKGLHLAHGDYVLFLNAGDKIRDSETISNIFRNNPPADIYYGKVDLINDQGLVLGERRLKPPAQLNWRSFRWGMLVSHQAFIPKRILTENYYLKYRISADIDWCIRCMKKANTIVNTQEIISEYLVGGESRKNTYLSWKERFKIMQEHYGFITTCYTHILIIIRFLGYYYQTGKLD